MKRPKMYRSSDVAMMIVAATDPLTARVAELEAALRNFLAASTQMGDELRRWPNLDVAAQAAHAALKGSA